MKDIERKTSTNKLNEEGDDGNESSDPDLMFRIIIEKPSPELVKLSRKNIALVTICQDDEGERAAKGNAKLIEFFMNNKKPTWGG